MSGINKDLEDVSFGLQDLLSVLRTEIGQAVEAVSIEQPDIVFDLGEIEVELQTVVTKEDSVNGKIKILAFEAGASDKLASAQTQKIKLKLKTDFKGGKTKISNEVPNKFSG